MVITVVPFLESGTDELGGRATMTVMGYISSSTINLDRSVWLRQVACWTLLYTRLNAK
jgi:hypothetical protein